MLSAGNYTFTCTERDRKKRGLNLSLLFQHLTFMFFFLSSLKGGSSLRERGVEYVWRSIDRCVPRVFVGEFGNDRSISGPY